MCGIVGFVGNREAAPVLLNALRKLEYRGYDSAGMATGVDGRICVEKGVGKLAEVEQAHQLLKLPGMLGIGHVRWATHGGVTDQNAHPHLDCHGEIAVVHNGIIENFQELRSSLEPRHDFVSDTDTEVIAHLIEEHTQDGMPLEEAVFQTTRQLEGSYALLVVSAKEPGKIVGARKDSPLVAGLGERCNLIASDTLCLLEETDQVIFIDEGEIAVLTGNSIKRQRQYGREHQVIKFGDSMNIGHHIPAGSNTDNIRRCILLLAMTY